MDSDKIPSPERIVEQCSFEDYRYMCDEGSDAFRPIGIIDPSKYAEALKDDTTVFIETNVGLTPAIVGLEYSDGYDLDRCRQLTDTQKVYLLGIPVKAIEAELNIPINSAIIVESDSSSIDDDKRIVSEHVGIVDGDKPVCADFNDPRIKDNDHKPAFMALYAAKALNKRPNLDSESQIGNIKEAFRSTDAELLPRDGLTLFDKDDLLAHPDVVEEVWNLFKDRFQWLGDYHPVSMEDTREVFNQILFSETTFTPLKFIDGRLVCAGIIVNEMSDIDWLKDSTISALNSALDQGTESMYFFGIAAVQGDDDAMNNMEDVVHFHCDLSAITGKDFLVIFESSNMSSLYIPRITEQYINSSGSIQLDGSFEEIAKMQYWFAK